MFSRGTDKYSAEDLKRKKIEEGKTELNRIWTLHPAYIKAKYIAEEARQHNAWLYDPMIKRWYTPEEFVSETSQFPDDAQIFTKIQIRNPIDGTMHAINRWPASTKNCRRLLNACSIITAKSNTSGVKNIEA